MLAEIYDRTSGNTLFKLELPVLEIDKYISLMKSYGCEDMEGDEYKFDDAKFFCDGITIYVEAV